MPIGILCLLLGYAIHTKNRTKSKKLVATALIFLYIFANPLLINELLLWWETPPTSISTVKIHDVGILLTGGIINDEKLPQENIFLGKSADRIAQTIELYKKGKINKILISGGEISVLGKTHKKEIEEIAKYLIISGIPNDKIFLEAHSQIHEKCSQLLKDSEKNISKINLTY